MRKAKVITALVLTVAMLVAMTGIAAADDEEELQSCDVNGNPKDVFGPNDRIYVTDKPGVTLAEHTPTGKIWIVENLNWGPGMNGLNLSKHSYHMDVGTTTYPDVYVSGVGVDSNGKFYGTHVTNGIVDICAVSELSGVYPDSYDIVYDADGDGYYNCTDTNCPDKVDKLTCQGITTVPEFATIAIPVAAILGLLFFYNYRKRKEE